MKQTLFAIALVGAFLVAGTASAQPVAGFSPSLADPQPVTNNFLAEDANRLIRWQGWLDVDAFSASVLEQMQKQLETGAIQLGEFKRNDPSVIAIDRDGNNAKSSLPETFSLDPKRAKFYVWLYRHNYTDTGLYQLYVSIKEPGSGTVPQGHPYRDIQSLGYEFGPPSFSDGKSGIDIEIWRGAVVRVNARGALVKVGVEGWDNRDFGTIGNVAGVIPGTTQDMSKEEDVKAAPVSDWERAPKLPADWNPIGGKYIPTDATGPEYVEPLERATLDKDGNVITYINEEDGKEYVRTIEENAVQKATGSVPKKTGDFWKDAQEQGRVITTPVTNGRWLRGTR